MNLFIDTETFSPVPIDRGLARYATQVEVMIVTWAIDDGPVHTWDVMATSQVPPAFITAVGTCDRILAHNAQFDRTVLEAQHWWTDTLRLTPAKFDWYCTMAMCFRHGLPGGLDKLSTIFRLPADKMKKEGRALIQLFCKPQKGGERATRHTHPKEWKEFLTYAGDDIHAMREVYRKCPKWNDTPRELALWDLDQKINARGIAVDLDFAAAALRATTAEQKRLAQRTQELTNDTVMRATQRDRLLAFLFVEHGVTLPDLKADTVERRLNDPELPEYVKELLRLRQAASKSSTSKYKRLLEMQVAGRLMYLLQYCGAYRTGRWGGRNFQPQNLKRPSLKFEEILLAISAVLEGCEDVILDDIMEAMSSAVRSVLIASPGKKLVVSDYSNIEGRDLAWIAGERWKLDAFAAFDRGEGPDLYKVAYGRAFNVDPTTVGDDSLERQIGKVMELALGYQGGVAAFIAMAVTYGIDLQEMADRARPTIPKHVLLDAEGMWEWATRKGRTLGLEQGVFVVCEALKRLWRDAHPETVALWETVENAARSAIANPGHEFHAGRLTFDRKGAWLRMRLPSGRYLLYPNPKVEGQQIEFAAWNVYTKSWRHEPTYGGKLVENACQAVARDIMVDGMFEAEAAGYATVLTVHDELVTEVPNPGAYSAKELSAILASESNWTAGLPLAAKGFETQRYRKS
jgi:DNA polymerase bacteriophage-type